MRCGAVHVARPDEEEEEEERREKRETEHTPPLMARETSILQAGWNRKESSTLEAQGIVLHGGDVDLLRGRHHPLRLRHRRRLFFSSLLPEIARERKLCLELELERGKRDED